MILIDNRNVLRIKDRELLSKLSVLDDREPTGDVIVEFAKTGVPTIKILIEGRTQYLQSKYDPKNEAERFARKFENEPINHVLFIGIGLGYHIQKFMETHQDTKFSIYEPNEEVFHAYLSNFQLDNLPLRNLVKIIVGKEKENVEREIQQLINDSNNVLKIITLPVYEKIYSSQVDTILEKALESLKSRHNSLATNVSFQKRWTINSIKNFPTVLKTPNILHDVDRSAFERKPAIIVAAGPSLNEDFENLRYIKENGLAYIFSVGSAINALIEQGIYPDAACTYDPSERNQLVFEKLKSKGIKDIPLIFGSSVGYETLHNYPGKMLHMLTNQDTVAQLYIPQHENKNVVSDAPSIAVVTFQLLSLLGCSPIILAGQNLAYLDNHRYADGINYDFVKSTLSDQEQKNTLLVEDVYGNIVQTSKGFNIMRQQLELYIGQARDIEVINTTKGGALIKGTDFMSLERVIKEKLVTRAVQEIGLNKRNSYSWHYSENQIENTNNYKRQLERNISHAVKVLQEIKSSVTFNQVKELDKKFNFLDEQFDKIINNPFQKAFIEPMLRVHKERLVKETTAIRFERNLLKKGERIAEIFASYIIDCQAHVHAITPYVEEMHEQIINSKT